MSSAAIWTSFVSGLNATNATQFLSVLVRDLGADNLVIVVTDHAPGCDLKIEQLLEQGVGLFGTLDQLLKQVGVAAVQMSLRSPAPYFTSKSRTKCGCDRSFAIASLEGFIFILVEPPAPFGCLVDELRPQYLEQLLALVDQVAEARVVGSGMLGRLLERRAPPLGTDRLVGVERVEEIFHHCPRRLGACGAAVPWASPNADPTAPTTSAITACLVSVTTACTM